MTPGWRRRQSWRGSCGGALIAAALVLLSSELFAQSGRGRPIERTTLRIGMGGPAPSLLPVHVGAADTLAEAGLRVELVTLAGEAVTAQAIASDSVDVAVGSPSLLLNLLSAGVPVKAFYAGYLPPDYEWFTRSEIQSWRDLRGRSVGISSLGGMTDGLTRYALTQHGVDPAREVRIVVSGGPTTRLSALRAGRLDAAILQAPASWQAEAEGFRRLGTQASEVGEEWPFVLIAKTRRLDELPRALTAFLRGYVRAVRRVKAEREEAVQTLERWLHYERRQAERTYDETARTWTERGAPSSRAMAAFWAVAIATGEASARLPEPAWFDRRFVDSFDEWAPR